MNKARWCDFEELGSVVTRQFKGGMDSVHGPSHWKRVERNGLWLCRRHLADPFVVRLFAWFHDAKRENEYTDPGHGGRGADFARSLRGTLFDLEEDAFEKLLYACTWHTDRHHASEITIGTCWDADRLDLGRVDMIPSPDFMSTESGRLVAKEGSFHLLQSPDEC